MSTHADKLRAAEQRVIDAADFGNLLADSVLTDVTHAAVKCKHCGTDFNASREAIARYFRSGWPICCGETALFSVKKSGTGSRSPEAGQ